MIDTYKLKHANGSISSPMNVLTPEERAFILSPHREKHPEGIAAHHWNFQKKSVVKRMMVALENGARQDDATRMCRGIPSSNQALSHDEGSADEKEIASMVECIDKMIDTIESEMKLKINNTVFKMYAELGKVSTVAYLEKEVSRMNRTGGTLSILVASIGCAHTCSDLSCQVNANITLKKLGESIKRHLRKYDQAGKFGENELLVVLPEANAEFAKVVAKRIENDPVLKNIVAATMQHKAKMNVRIAEYKSGDDVNTLLQRASAPSALMQGH